MRLRTSKLVDPADSHRTPRLPGPSGRLQSSWKSTPEVCVAARLTGASNASAILPLAGSRRNSVHQKLSAAKPGLKAGSKQLTTAVPVARYVIASSISIRYQSSDNCSPASRGDSNGERSTMPAVSVSAFSGSRSGLPPNSIGNSNSRKSSSSSSGHALCRRTAPRPRPG